MRLLRIAVSIVLAGALGCLSLVVFLRLPQDGSASEDVQRDASGAPELAHRMTVEKRAVSPEQESPLTALADLSTGSFDELVGAGRPDWMQQVPDPASLRFPEILDTFDPLNGLDQVDLSETGVVDVVTSVLAAHFPSPLTGRDRRVFTSLLESIEVASMAQTYERATLLGIPTEGVDENGVPFRLIGFENGEPVYSVPVNVEAAISSAASFVRQNSDFDAVFGPEIDGSGFFINVNDYGVVRQHNEFQLPARGGSRLIEREEESNHSHPDHVAGTIGAHGYDSQLKGMAPAVNMYALNQQSSSDVYLLGMEYPFQMRRSIAGSTSLGHDTSPFGSYSFTSFDQSLYQTPYYLHFCAAANNGSNGFDSISRGYNGQKNVLTVGSAGDLPRNADGSPNGNPNVSGFSSRGPMDDGRIKPDIVANGEGLLSTKGTSGTSRKSGTSMATPNASGSAILLQDVFSNVFPGHLMRANTLKNLILHTAEDRGETGPDYKYGWGYMNTLTAANLIKDYAAEPGSMRLIEARLENGETHAFTFSWDGSSPVKVNLSWEEPAGSYQSSDDDRTPRLVHDLDLRVEDSEGAVHLPWAMPLVLNDFADMADAGLPAVRADNTVDNIEQVMVDTPVAGTYTVRVSHKGSLGADVRYSLILSGTDPSDVAPAPVIHSFTPDLGIHDDTLMTIEGEGFLLGANVLLRKAGRYDVQGQAEIVTPRRIEVRMPLDFVAGDHYTLLVQNPDGQTAEASTPFTVPHYTDLLSEDFEDGFSFSAEGWQTGADTGSDDWTLATDTAASGTTSVFVPTLPAKVDSWLVSPTISIPQTSEPVVVTFLHQWDFEIILPSWAGAAEGADAGILELSVDGSQWLDVGTLADTQIVAGDYWDNVDYDNPLYRNSSTYAWTDTSDGFIRTTLTLDPSIFSGTDLQLRWRLGTDSQGADTGWWIDDVSIRAAYVNQPGSIAITSPDDGHQLVRGGNVSVTADATDPDGINRVEYLADGILVATAWEAPYDSVIERVWEPGMNLVARLVDSMGEETLSQPVAIGTYVVPEPAEWATTPIEGFVSGGMTSMDPSTGAFHMMLPGNADPSPPDDFHFARQEFIGEGEIIACLTGFHKAGGEAMAGIMIRESLYPESRYAILHMRASDHSIGFTSRNAAGLSTVFRVADPGEEALPAWIRLTREGDRFAAWHSADGIAWTEFAAETIAMTAEATAGLFLAGSKDGHAAYATFASVEVNATGGLPPPAGILSPSESWQFDHFGSTVPFGETLPSADFDKDGIANLMERASGTDPTRVADRFEAIASEVRADGQAYLALTYRQQMGGSGTIGVDYSAQGMTYRVEYGSSLAAPWTYGDVVLVSVQDDWPVLDIQTVTVRLTTPLEQGIPQFIRLSVTDE